MTKIKVVKISQDDLQMKEKISKIIKVPSTDIKLETLKYYYIEPGWCCKQDIDEMFIGIKKYEFVTPIKKLEKYYHETSSTYFSKLLESCVKYKLLFDKNELIKKNSSALDSIMLNFLQCRKQSRFLYIFPSMMKENSIDTIVNNLKDHTLYYIKKVSLSKSGAKSLLYQLYSITGKHNIIDLVDKKVEQFGWNTDNDYTFYAILYEPNESSNNKISNNESINNIFSTNSFIETIEQGKLLLNANSIKFLNDQKYENFLRFYKTPSTFMFNTFKNWLYINIKPIDQIRFLLYSSIILYTYGYRLSNDIDGVIKDIPKKATTKNLGDKIKSAFINTDSKFPFTDILLKEYNEEIWPSWWEDHMTEIAKLLKAKTIDDLILDPKQHYYFMGIKILRIEGDIIKRQHRCKPRSFADLIALKIYYDSSIKIPKIPIESQHQKRDINKNKFLGVIKWCLNKRYHINLTIKNIESLIEK